MASVAVPATATGGATSGTASARALHYCYGRVSKVDDGDTINVHLSSPCFGIPAGHLVIVRNAAIQATEIAHAPGQHNECWSIPAKNFFHRLMPHGHEVRLAAHSETSAAVTDHRGRGRVIMYVETKTASGWKDVQAAELLAGLAIWKAQHDEAAYQSNYLRDMQRAIKGHKGMWAPGADERCARAGKTYDSRAQLQSWIVWKTEVPDKPAVANQEAYKVRNVGSAPVNLTGWKVRDGSHDFFKNQTYLTLPHITLQPHQVLTVHPGSGTNDPAKRVVYVDYTRHLPYFPNAPMGGPLAAYGTHPAHAYPGQAMYLLDPNLDFRSWAVYPCVVACGQPPLLKITAARYSDPHHESFTFTNRGRTTANLTGDVFEADGHAKNFPTGDSLAPGRSIVLHVQGNNPDTATNLYWHRPANSLINAGERVWLRTWQDVTIDTYSWGNGGHYDYYK